MNQTLKLLISFIVVALAHSSTSAQKSSNKLFQAVKEYAKKNHKKELLSMQMLKSATEISYSFTNGSVAPEYQYYEEIIVTPQYVTLNVINQSNLCYSRSHTLTSRQYSDFLTKLYSLGVKKSTDEFIPMCGEGVSKLLIKNGDRIMFKGSEDEDIVTSKGRLSNPFLPLLNTEMRDIFDDPSSTFGVIH